MAARRRDLGVREGCGMRVALLTPAIGSGNAGDAMIESAIRRLVPANSFRQFSIRRPLDAREMTELNGCDAAILCGSNLYQAKRQCALSREFLDQLRIPLIPLGVGTSAPSGTLPQVSDEDAEMIRLIHSRSALSSVRDGATHRFVQSLGVDNVRLTGCPVLFHGLQRPRIELRDESRICVSLRQTFLHGAEPLEGRQDPLLEALCKAHRPTLVCQGAYDLPQARRLAKRYGLEMLYDDDWHCDIHEWLVKRQRWTGGFRLHYGMLSLSYGAPAWFISHDTRVEEFCKLVGLPWVDIRTATTEDVLAWGPDRMSDFAALPNRWDELAQETAEVLAANGLPCALHEPPPAKPKVLFLVPRRDWAYDFSAKALQTGLAPKMDVRIRYSTDTPALRPEPYDLAVVFFWGENPDLLKGFDPNRILKYVSSHRWQFPGKHGPHSPGSFVETYLADAGTVFVTSKRLLQLLQDVHSRVRHAPNGYDPKLFHPLEPRQGPLAVGAAGWAEDAVKGFRDLLVRAVKGYQCAVAGGDHRHEDMNDFYSKLDVLLVSSHHEGEPLTLIEAMAAGCFPVASDVGIVPELVRNGENGLIVTERTAEAFQAALAWCSEHLETVREMGLRNAEQMRNERAWPVVLTTLTPLFEEAVSNGFKPHFHIVADNSAETAARRITERLNHFRQSVAPPNADRSAACRDLAKDASTCWESGSPWKPRAGCDYVIECDAVGPRSLGWEGLERCLREAFTPPPPQVPGWTAKLRSAVKRWLAISDR